MTWQDMCYDLWGKYWHSVLAGMVPCDKRSVERWCSGQRQIPQDIENDIKETYELWRDIS